MDEERPSSATFLVERRRADRRIAINVPVEVSLVQPPSPPLTEKTFIEDVSDFGCRFSTRGAIHQGNSISVKLLGPDGKVIPSDEPRLYEVMWVARKERSYTVGARLIQGETLKNSNIVQEKTHP